MARSIRFIAPVESLSGNLSGAQDLLYPTHDNSAFESPEDAVNYARNYKPRYVGTYRRKDGSVSFQVKTRTAVHMTADMIRAMAVMGGSGAIIGAILRNSQYTAACNAQFVIENEQGAGWKSLRQFLDAKIRPELTAKSETIVIAPVGGIFSNPWAYKTGSGVNVLQIPNTVLVKFWEQLASNPLFFTVEGLKGVAHSGDTWADVIARHYNVLSLTAQSGGQYDLFIKKGTLYLNYLDPDDTALGVQTADTVTETKFFLDTIPGESGG